VTTEEKAMRPEASRLMPELIAFWRGGGGEGVRGERKRRREETRYTHKNRKVAILVLRNTSEVIGCGAYGGILRRNEPGASELHCKGEERGGGGEC
jgi:hypothetical protein